VNQFSSHQNDPISAAALLGVVEIIEEEKLVAHAAEMGRYLREQLTALAKMSPQLMNVRGRGLMNGFDVFRDPAHPTPDAAVGRAVEDFCRARGVHLEAIQKNRFRILPPLVISRAEIDVFVGVLGEALAALAGGRAAPRPTRNRYTAAFEVRKKSVIAATAKWAWTHSPSEWVTKIRGALR
jgi:2,2-dialkylglycine decarboxylase (pyruvate)